MNSMRIEMSPRQVQVQKLAPRMIQTLEILQLPIAALQERVERELQENPVLEVRDNAEAETEEPKVVDEGEKFDPDAPMADKQPATVVSGRDLPAVTHTTPPAGQPSPRPSATNGRKPATTPASASSAAAAADGDDISEWI